MRQRSNEHQIQGIKKEIRESKSPRHQRPAYQEKTCQDEKPPSTPLEQPRPEESQKEKIVITGDDILIEYVQRVVSLLKMLPPERRDTHIFGLITDSIKRFVTHSVWHVKEQYQL